MNDWVFVDTCIWAAFFAKPDSLEKKAVDDLIDADRVALVGPIFGRGTKTGHKVPLTDLAVAVMAKRLDSFVYSTDPDFDAIQDLKRFSP